MNKALYSSALASLLVSAAASAQQTWQIHEWGTFTSLQDESGQAIGGINTDDEPVPPFVHRVFPVLPADDVIPRQFNKGLPGCHRDVTMRLETPVIYFHPPPGTADGQNANVRVKFRGGWLTEFYPSAASDAPGLTNGCRLYSSTVGQLEWENLQVGGDWPLTNTSEHIWTSPRAVETASVKNAEGESEKFLFYRGVGHMDAPLKVSYSGDGSELLFRNQLENVLADKPLEIHALWLVNIRPNGEIAFRTLPSVALGNNSDEILARTPSAFLPGEYSLANFDKLKDSLKAALVSEGLFNDEAQALLKTWEVSYFKSPGLRVFFLCPRAWTDHYLPLQISLRAQINRVMVGRIELVTPSDRKALQELAGFSPAAIQDQAQEFFKSGLQHYQEFRDVYAGKRTLASVASVPESYQIYVSLGRFRNALLLDEEKKRPTPGLASFIAAYGLSSYPASETHLANREANLK
ncbi:MAG TPA: hypothetical protein VK811_01875 [Candidatus Acidoferrum sp.]|nr:hypothetical protein [Candidatus Acidoferrum sp.]